MVRCGRTITLLAVLTLAPGPRPAAEDGASAGGPSVRVRVTTAKQRYVGRLLAIRPESLSVEHGSGPERRVVDVPRSRILGLELSQKRSRKPAGVGIGFAAGLGVALALGVLESEVRGVPTVAPTVAPTCLPPPPGSQAPPPPCRDTISFRGSSMSSSSRLALLALPFATAVFGAVLAPGEKWGATDVDELSLRLGPAPGGGVAASLVLRF